MTNPTQLKLLISHRQNHHPVTTRYECQGGPFNRKHLVLSTPSTARLVIGTWRGQYVARSSHPPIILWTPALK